jgi:lysophosphatidylcholine acyltransferase/lyso-PAF acetyltransferase
MDGALDGTTAANDDPSAPLAGLQHGTAEAPFTRHDRYGDLGVEPQPLTEQLRLALLALCLLPLKVVGTLACLLSYYAVIQLSAVAFPASVRSDWVAALGRWHCRGCLFCLGFLHIKWVKVPAPPGAAAQDGAPPKAWGIVSSHSSWLDILVHMSHSFPSFVARDATRHTPIIGAIRCGVLPPPFPTPFRPACPASWPHAANAMPLIECSQAMECVYVDRSKRGAQAGAPGVAALVKQRMAAAAAGSLPHSRPMLLFPEGTTTNGSYMLPFRTGAFLAGLPLQPVLVRYDTHTVSPAWETIAAARHIFLILCNPSHSVTCYELPVYVPSDEERADPKLFAANVRRVMVRRRCTAPPRPPAHRSPPPCRACAERDRRA